MSPFLIVAVALTISLPPTLSQQEGTFTNPIIDGNSADPFVGKVGDSYYMLLSTRTESELTIYKSAVLTDFRNAESKVIFKAPAGYHNVWASEMHEIDGNLYIYFAMGKVGEFNRNWVIKADDPRNPMGGWSSTATLLVPHLDQPGVDGTILKHKDKDGVEKVYYVWSGRDGTTIPHDSILITEMTDPMSTTTQTTIIRQPLLPWERNVNEGPFFIYNKNVSYLVFSASFTFSEYYCLGLMSIDAGQDPMVASNWWYGPEDGPVFEKNEDEHVFGSGHASFTTSPDGTETWMIYHASEDRERIEHYRIARAEKITWDDVTGRPVFPRPHGYLSPQPIPSGQQQQISKTTFTNPIMSGDSPDPSVLKLSGYYYLPLVYNQNHVIIHQTPWLTNFRNFNSSNATLYFSHELCEIWSPKLVKLDNSLHLFFSGRACDGTTPHTLYVANAKSANSPMGQWSSPLPLLLPEVNFVAADPALLIHNNNMYVVYESREEPYGLWIVQMSDENSAIVGSRKPLKAPAFAWEQGVVNAPAFVKRGDTTFMSYSGGNPNGPDYATGMMAIRDGQDPMVAENWTRVGGNEPVFKKDEAEGVFGPGHMSFTESPDGRETWITYHAAEYSDRIFGNRITRAEKLDWNSNGEPVFPKPHGFFSPQPLPSGQV